MMDILKRKQAALTDRAWQEIDAAVRNVLVARLCGRKVVEVEGPLGVDASAINLGRLEVAKRSKSGAVHYGIRKVQPLVEGRINFDLDIWELDNVERGARDLDLAAAEAAALAMARFEDTAIFNGFAPGGITGLTQLKAHDPIYLTLEPATLLGALTRGIVAMNDSAVDGPFHLVVGPQVFKTLSVQQTSGYPLSKQVSELIGGQVHYSTVLKGALLISGRGGDFELTLGQDLSVGYDSRNAGKVTLFVGESFTFRVLDPSGSLYLPLKGKK
jgi:uncharacterized linocin/CFP29 family protein